MQKRKLNLHIYGIHLLNPYKTVVSHLKEILKNSKIGLILWYFLPFYKRSVYKTNTVIPQHRASILWHRNLSKEIGKERKRSKCYKEIWSICVLKISFGHSRGRMHTRWRDQSWRWVVFNAVTACYFFRLKNNFNYPKSFNYVDFQIMDLGNKKQYH